MAGRSAFGAYHDHAWFGHGVIELFSVFAPRLPDGEPMLQVRQRAPRWAGCGRTL